MQQDYLCRPGFLVKCLVTPRKPGARYYLVTPWSQVRRPKISQNCWSLYINGTISAVFYQKLRNVVPGFPLCNFTCFNQASRQEVLFYSGKNNTFKNGCLPAKMGMYQRCCLWTLCNLHNRATNMAKMANLWGQT